MTGAEKPDILSLIVRLQRHLGLKFLDENVSMVRVTCCFWKYYSSHIIQVDG